MKNNNEMKDKVTKKEKEHVIIFMEIIVYVRNGDINVHLSLVSAERFFKKYKVLFYSLYQTRLITEAYIFKNKNQDALNPYLILTMLN